jgi:hypothetical protein
MDWSRIERTYRHHRVRIPSGTLTQEHVGLEVLVHWLLHSGLTREKVADIAGLGRASSQCDVAVLEGDLDG